MVVEQGPQLAIIGAEIVAPLADAMCFVDGDEGEVCAVGQTPEPVERGPLRSDVKQVEFPGVEALDRCAPLRAVEPEPSPSRMPCRTSCSRARRAASRFRSSLKLSPAAAFAAAGFALKAGRAGVNRPPACHAGFAGKIGSRGYRRETCPSGVHGLVNSGCYRLATHVAVS